jgi:two-component system NtrC family sensor kinase
MGLIVGTYLVFMAGGIGLVVLASRRLQHTITLPLRALSVAAREFAEGTFARRVPVASADEIGELSRSFNWMAQTIEEDQATLRRWSEELERKVRDRTSELEEANRQLRLAQARVVESEKAALIGQIAAGVAHEVRTPLNAMAINLQIIRRARAREMGPACGDCLQIVGTVEHEVERINRSLEGFVSFARLPVPQHRWVDVGPLVRDACRLFEPQAKEAGVTLRAEVPSDLPRIRADADQIRQVVTNLILNAIQAMPDGGEALIEAVQSAGEREPGIRLRVRDSGPGVPGSHLPRIFEPFFTTKGTGLGLGLAMVKRIVEAHGGAITCESQLGVGTQFDIVLPAAEAAGEA